MLSLPRVKELLNEQKSSLRDDKEFQNILKTFKNKLLKIAAASDGTLATRYFRIIELKK